MAKKTRTWLLDDKEAAAGNDVEAEQTVEFGIDGTAYEIDLTTKNATKLRNEINQWAQYARKVGTQRGRRPGGGHNGASGMTAEQSKAAREWLRKNGHPDLPDRGRIPAAALAEFHARASVA